MTKGTDIAMVATVGVIEVAGVVGSSYKKHPKNKNLPKILRKKWTLNLRKVSRLVYQKLNL